MKSKNKNRGFSVVEMLVTLAITAILLMVVIGVGRSARQRGNFTTSLNRFVADFSYARQLASRENRYVAIDFNDRGTAYEILTQDSVGNIQNFSSHRIVEPLDGDDFFVPNAAIDFVINSLGVIKAYPMVVNGPTITVNLSFYQKNKAGGAVDFTKNITIYPAGGIKVDD